MDDLLYQAVIQATGNVFETMFFVFLEPIAPDSDEARPALAASGPEGLECRIGFQGRNTGELRFLIPYTLARDMATNFLGLETEATESQTVDMVKELTNMVCGNLFSIYDKQQVYLLDIPTARLVGNEPEGVGGSPSLDLRVDFLAEDQIIRLEIAWGGEG